jgi:arylsulfatase A-like enzyme
MQRQGYATGIIGKWHLGLEEHCQPNKRGFGQQFGFYEAYSLYYPDTANPNILNQRHDDFSDKYIWSGGRKGSCAIRRNHEVVEDSVYLTTRLAIEAGKFIDQHKQEPFFLYVPFSAPHTPFQVPREYYDQFAHIEDRNKRIYYGMIKALDDAVGYIQMKLEQAGIEENTMVWFLSDNGGATYTHATDNAPLKGGKFTNFEGGLNVPFLWKWPAKIKPATQCSQPVVAMDIFATIAWASGLQLPEDRPYDGVNLLPYLWGKAGQAPHEALFWRSNYSWAVRQGPWKLVCDEKSGHRVLYNLDEDKEEKNNLYNISPDQAKALTEAYKQWESGMAPPKWQYVMDFKYDTKDGEFYFPL